MDDFLDAPRPTYACNSVDDLTLHLGGLREQKVTHVRAEHISATFEFSSTAVFDVPETQNDAADPQNLDPTLGGSPRAAPVANMNGGAPPATQVIRAHDTLMNQPTDDPSLQKLVAKHIITILGNADGSSWTVRSVSRNSSGWTFTYLCKSSTQVWMRQNSKSTAKLLVGESSGKDGQDPVNLARPAFDCRGSVTIAFSKNNRMITVKLAHTPLHKTVAELAELFKPPPPPPVAEVGRRKDGESNRRRSQAADGVANGEEGGRKKRKEKSANPDGQEHAAAEGEGVKTPKAKRPRPSRAKQPKGTDAQAEAQAQADSQNDALLGLSSMEVARRKDEANRKLRDAGIEPETLSIEQFDIFANQSPELQTESLAMLVKYGAERLRIVHPNQDNAPQSDDQASADGTTPDGSTKKKKKSRKSGLNEDGTPKVKKTRGSCQSCRENKSKCSKAKPECLQCLEAGIACFYPPEQKRKSHGIKPTEGNEDEPAEPTPGPAPESIAEPVVEQADEAAAEEASDLGSPGFNNSHVPVPIHAPVPTAASAPEMMAQPVHNPTTSPEVSHDASHDLYQPAATGLSYPQGVSEHVAAGTDYFQHQPTSSAMSYPHQLQQPSNVAYPEPVSTAAQHVPQPVQTVPPQPTRPTSSHSSSRHTLPSGSGQNVTGYQASGDANHVTASWQSSNTTVEAAQPYANSPTVRQSASSRQSRSRNTAAPSVYETPQQERLAAATTLSQAALQNSRSSPAGRIVSPFQTPAQSTRSRPRQGQKPQRSQSRPTNSPFQQSSEQPAAVDAPMYNSSVATDSNSLPSYDHYARYDPAATQPHQPSSRVAYEPYSQQNASNSNSASYPGYDAYSSRSQASSASSLANSATQSISSSYTKTTAPSSNSWSTFTSSPKKSAYGSQKAAGPPASTYDVPASSTQQQPASLQSFNVRPQPPLPQSSRSNSNTPTSYTQHPRQQQHQSYNSYSSQPHNPSSQPPPQQSQPQQDWYGFGSGNNAASNYGSGSNSQHRSVNLANNSYSNLNEQDALYEMFRSNSRH